MVVRTLQVSGVRGEITPLMHARVDTEFYQASVAEASNVVVTRYGGFTRTPGTIFDGYVKADHTLTRMIPFEFNEQQIYAIEAGNLYFRFWTPEGQVLDSGSPYEIVSPFATEDLPYLHGKQVGDVLYLFTGGRKRVYILKRLGETNWVIEPYTPKDGPYLPINDTPTTLTPAGRNSLTPFMTSNTLPSGVVSSSPAAADAYTVFDGDESTIPGSWNAKSGYVQYDAGSDKIVDRYWVQAPNNLVWVDGTPTSWRVLGSNNGSAWTTLDTRTGENGWGTGEVRFFEMNNRIAFRYYRFAWTGSDRTADNYTWVAEIAFNITPASQTAFNLTASSTTGINGGAGFRTDDVGRPIRLQGSDGQWRWAEIITRSSATVVTVKIYGQALPDLTPIINWRLGAWSEYTGWPYTGRLFEDRLSLGGANGDPIGMWMSVSGAYDSFRTSTPPVDDDALILRLTGGKLNPIKWLAESGTLLAGTADVLRTVGGRDNGAALSPTNIRQRAETAVGAARIEPVEIENVVLFIDRHGRRLYEAGYSYEADGYLAREVSTLNEHLFRPGIEQIVFLEDPFKFCLCRRSDGKVIFFAYDREQKIVGGTLSDFGMVRDIMTMPGRDGTDVWIVVDRGTRTTIERLAPFHAVDGLVDGMHVPVQSLCSTVYDLGVAASVFNVPTALNGMTLGVWADGRDLGDATVTAGQITLPFSKTAKQVVVGIRMPWTIKTLRLATYGQQDGSGLGRNVRIVEAFVDLFASAGVAGGTLTETQPVIDEASAEYNPDDIQPLLTGMYPIHADDSFLNRGVFVMTGQSMHPATIRGFSLAVEGEP